MRVVAVAVVSTLFCLAISCANDDRAPTPGAADASVADVRPDTAGQEAAPAGPCACSGGVNDRLAFPLACHCDGQLPGTTTWGCSSTRATSEATICQGVGAVVRMTGCGKVSLMSTGGFAGSNLTFDEATGQLVGVTAYSDVGFGACSAAEYRFGASLRPGIECTSSNMQFCLLCGDRALLGQGSNVSLPSPLPDCTR